MTNNQLAKVEAQLLEEKNVSDSVLNKVRVLEHQGNLNLPKDYDPANALKQAWLQITDNSKLLACTDASKATAFLDMVTQGLNPAKNQCYFIPYGNKMQLQRSYHGNIMMLKRDAGAKDVVAQVIYEGDKFKTKMNNKGQIVEVEHEQDFFNIDKDKIKGAYCTIIFDDDNKQDYVEIMTIEQIEQAWLQSAMIKDKKALETSKTHNNFKEEMSKKTVINRAAKRYINTSTDANLQIVKEIEQRQRKEVFDAEIEEKQAVEVLDIDDVEPVEQVHDVTDFEEVEDLKPAPTSEATESDEDPF